MQNLTEEQIYRFSRNRILQELIKRNLSTKGDIDILKTRLIVHSYPSIEQQQQQQSFDYLAIIDFEATCVAKPTSSYIQEIIEFPIVLIDIAQQRIIDQFHSYCRPVLKPQLSDYCKKLTGITQEQVDNAPTFVNVFANVLKWLTDRDLLTNPQRKCTFVTDSRSDFNKYLSIQCEISQIEYPKWAYQWINIKNTFQQFYRTQPGRIHNMLDKLDIPFVGNLHSGLDDATNIGQIAIQLLKDGCILVQNEFLYPMFASESTNSSRMICLNCSKCHAEIQDSCIQQKQPISTNSIPSLLDLPFRPPINHQ